VYLGDVFGDVYGVVFDGGLLESFRFYLPYEGRGGFRRFQLFLWRHRSCSQSGRLWEWGLRQIWLLLNYVLLWQPDL